MTTYAGIAGGVVARLLTTTMTLEQFAAPGFTWLDVTATVPLPRQGWAAAEVGGVWTFTAPTPTFAQQAAALLSGGLTITSASVPALNGTYACDSDAVTHVMAEMISVLNAGTFCDGTASVVWADATGATHTFASVALWKPFALAVGAFVAAVQKCLIGASTTLPAATATIA